LFETVCTWKDPFYPSPSLPIQKKKRLCSFFSSSLEPATIPLYLNTGCRGTQTIPPRLNTGRVHQPQNRLGSICLDLRDTLEAIWASDILANLSRCPGRGQGEVTVPISAGCLKSPYISILAAAGHKPVLPDRTPEGCISPRIDWDRFAST
jgi:hypothetical protein